MGNDEYTTPELNAHAPALRLAAERRAGAQEPVGNRLDGLGEVNLIGRFWQVVEVTPAGERIEFMQFGDDSLRPFVILNSAEYPGLPPLSFCQDLQSAGYCTIAVQRPGFGASTCAPTLAGQLRILEAFIGRSGLRNIVLMAMGTGAPAGYHLAVRHPEIAFTLLTNVCFNCDMLSELRPAWFARQVRQAVSSQVLARAALSWIKGNARLFGHHQLFEKWYAKHAGDLGFLQDNREEFDEVANTLMEIDADTFRNEILMSVQDDPFLSDGRFAGSEIMAVSGQETTETWKQGFESETRRLGIEHAYLPSGDTFAPYLFPRQLAELADRHRAAKRASPSRKSAQA